MRAPSPCNHGCQEVEAEVDRERLSPLSPPSLWCERCSEDRRGRPPPAAAPSPGRTTFLLITYPQYFPIQFCAT